MRSNVGSRGPANIDARVAERHGERESNSEQQLLLDCTELPAARRIRAVANAAPSYLHLRPRTITPPADRAAHARCARLVGYCCGSLRGWPALCGAL